MNVFYIIGLFYYIYIWFIFFLLDEARVFFGKVVNDGDGDGGENVTATDIRSSLMNLTINQYMQLRKEAKEMHAGAGAGV